MSAVVRNSCGRIFYRHRWGDWVVTSSPFVAMPEVEARRCTRCHHVQLRSLTE